MRATSIALLAGLAVGCRQAAGDGGSSAPTAIAYQGSAAAGDYVKVTLSATAANAGSYSYDNLTNAQHEQGTYAVGANGLMKFTPTTATSKIESAFEVPNVGLVMIAGSAGVAANTTTILFAVPECAITIADISSGASPDTYNYVQFRTENGGFEFGAFSVLGTATSGTMYSPYGHTVTAKKGGDLGSSAVSPDGYSLSWPTGKPGEFATIFRTATSGLLGFDAPGGSLFMVKTTAAKDFDAKRAGTYSFMSYANAGTTPGMAEPAQGTVATGTMTITADAKLSVAGDANMQSLPLAPVADAKGSFLYGPPGAYTPASFGSFRTTSPDAAGTRETFVIFLEGAVLFNSIAMNGSSYAYWYGAGVKTP